VNLDPASSPLHMRAHEITNSPWPRLSPGLRWKRDIVKRNTSRTEFSYLLTRVSQSAAMPAPMKLPADENANARREPRPSCRIPGWPFTRMTTNCPTGTQTPIKRAQSQARVWFDESEEDTEEEQECCWDLHLIGVEVDEPRKQAGTECKKDVPRAGPESRV